MDIYPNHLTVQSAQERMEQREAYRREKEDKRQEWLESEKYYKEWSRQTTFLDKWTAKECLETSKPSLYSGNPPSVQLLIAKENRDAVLTARRQRLKNLLDTEERQYESELMELKKGQAHSGNTKDSMALKLSYEDTNRRRAFVSGSVNSRRNEELSHFRIFPNSSK